jgi:hypothetical protein
VNLISRCEPFISVKLKKYSSGDTRNFLFMRPISRGRNTIMARKHVGEGKTKWYGIWVTRTQAVSFFFFAVTYIFGRSDCISYSRGTLL